MRINIISCTFSYFIKFFILLIELALICLFCFVYNLTGIQSSLNFYSESLFLFTNIQFVLLIYFNVSVSILIAFVFKFIRNNLEFLLKSPFERLKSFLFLKITKFLAKHILKIFSTKKRFL